MEAWIDSHWWDTDTDPEATSASVLQPQLPSPPSQPLPATPADYDTADCSEVSFIGPESEDPKAVSFVAQINNTWPYLLPTRNGSIPDDNPAISSTYGLHFAYGAFVNDDHPCHVNKRRASGDLDQQVVRGPKARKIISSHEDSLHTTTTEHEDTQSGPEVNVVTHSDDVVYGEPHWDVGCDLNNKHCCSCGRKFAKAFRLKSHLDAASGTPKYRCSICDKTFARQDLWRRHEGSQHLDQKVDCPGCGKAFRRDYLSVHHASPKNRACKLAAQMMSMNEKMMVWAELSTTESASDVDDDCSEGTKTNKVYLDKPLDPGSEPTMSSSRPSREPCDLCGEGFGSDDDALVAHVQTHMLEFKTRPFKCDPCRVDFAHHRDLVRHRNASLRGHCGLGFRQQRGSTTVPHRCTGHHPPSPSSLSAAAEHKAMVLCLWAWEQCQLRAHIATINRLRTERLLHVQHHVSVDEKDLSYIKALTRLSRTSLNSMQSAQSEPAHLKYMDNLDIEALAADLGGFMIDSDMESIDLAIPRDQHMGKARPESLILSPDHGLGTPTRANADSAVHIVKRVPSRLASYVDRVQSLRSVRGKSRKRLV